MSISYILYGLGLECPRKAHLLEMVPRVALWEGDGTFRRWGPVRGLQVIGGAGHGLDGECVPRSLSASLGFLATMR
jgi:hypothetical protein